MELILVRHGQPAWSTPDRRNRNDPPLTDLGHAQAALAGARIADPDDEPARGPVDHVIASPALRAAQTAAPIGAALDMAVDTHAWLLEIQNPPHWDGSPIEDIEAAYAEMKHRTREQVWDGLPGGEPIRAFHQRVTTGLHAYLAGLDVVPSDTVGLWEVGPAAPQRVVAVAHAGTNSTIIANLLGAAPEPWEWDRFVLGHASVAVLRTTRMAGSHIWSLAGLGDAAHLPVDQRTL
jgi:probable phosphoglycerate mutase